MVCLGTSICNGCLNGSGTDHFKVSKLEGIKIL